MSTLVYIKKFGGYLLNFIGLLIFGVGVITCLDYIEKEMPYVDSWISSVFKFLAVIFFSWEYIIKPARKGYNETASKR